MLTQCPNCETTFRVTSEILRVADGQVRCGRCHTQFDALERLIDETDADEVQSGRFLKPPRAESPEPDEQFEDEEPVAEEDITIDGDDFPSSGRSGTQDETQPDEESGEEWIEIEDIEQATGQEAEIADAEDELASVEEGDAEADLYEQAEDVDVEPAEPSTYAPVYRARRAEAQPEAELELLSQRPRRAAIAPIWKILVGPLALLLTIQLVHSYRATIARHPRLGPPLMSVYRTLGLSLRPDWNLHAYEILQWHVGSNPQAPGTLQVRASIKNMASFPQPYPLLKLVLEDRWGEQVRARAFEPAEYLDAMTSPERFLAPAQQTNATISIVDPGPDAEGFRFDVCLRGAEGPVCAADVPRSR